MMRQPSIFKAKPPSAAVKRYRVDHGLGLRVDFDIDDVAHLALAE